MELENRKVALAFLALTVIASGCSHTGGNQSETSTSPISINEFSAFPNPAPANQNVQFRMELQNNGDVDAKKVRARLFNPPFDTDQNSQNPKTWRKSDGSVNRGDRTFKFGTLRAPTDNTPSVPKTQTKSFQAPNLAEGRTISYDFFSKIFYQYQTRANTEIQVMSSDRFRESGGARSKPTLDNSAGPIQMEIRTATPLVFYQGTSQKTSQLCVIVKNSGTGTPFLANSPAGSGPSAFNGNRYQVTDTTENKVWLEIQDIGNIDFTAKGSEASGNTVQVELIGKQGVQCFNMEAEFSQSSIQRTVNIGLNAYYGYTKETQTTVTVEGRGEGQDNTDPTDAHWEYKSQSEVSNSKWGLIQSLKNPESGEPTPASTYCPTGEERDSLCDCVNGEIEEENGEAMCVGE